MQGRAKNILTSIDKICTMRDKIEIWKHKVKERNFEIFPNFCNIELKFQISSHIINHLTLLREKLQYYFPNIKCENYDWITNPFLATSPTHLSLTEEQLAEIKNDRCLQLIYKAGDLQKFWIHVFKNLFKFS